MAFGQWGVWPDSAGAAAGGAARTLFQQMLGMGASRPLFTADRYRVDGGSGKVAAFIDWADPAHELVQANPAFQVAVPAAHADFGGALCATFTGAEFYVSNRPASSFRYCSDGTGFETTQVYTLTSVAANAIIAGTSNLGAITGYSHWFNNTPTVRCYFAATGPGTIASSGAACPGVGVPSFSSVAFDVALAAGTRVRLWLKSALPVSFDNAAAPSAGDPTGTLTFGCAVSGGAPFIGRWRSGVWSPTLTAEQRTAKWQWVQLDTGIAP